MPIYFKSKINSDYLDELESLMYFNSQQRKVISGIESAIEKYGLPKIKNENEKLKITLEKIENPQTIFAFDNDNLVGLIIFYRETIDNIVILHIAIAEQYSIIYNKSFSLAIALIEELKRKAKNIKGVKSISIYYKKDNIGKIRIK